MKLDSFSFFIIPPVGKFTEKRRKCRRATVFPCPLILQWSIAFDKQSMLRSEWWVRVVYFLDHLHLSFMPVTCLLVEPNEQQSHLSG